MAGNDHGILHKRMTPLRMAAFALLLELPESGLNKFSLERPYLARHLCLMHSA